MKVKICYIVTVPITIRSFFIPQLKYLANNGFDVSVVCSKDELLQQELGNAITYHPIEMPRGISFFGSLKAVWELFCYFREEGFDFIQYSTPNAAMYASIAGWLANIKVRNYHLMGFRYLGTKGILKFILKKMEKVSCKYSTHIECVSNSNLEIGIKEKVLEKEKTQVVWNGSSGGVDLKRFDYSKRLTYREEIRSKHRLSESDFVFGFVGRITRDKGINELLEAFLSIEDAKLLMIGEVEGASTLNQQIYNMSMENSNIIYVGQIEDVERYYAALDVLVLPSYREGFGNVIIEAAAMGTPAIVSNIPGPIDAVEDGKTAFIVNVKDTMSLLKAMRKIQAIDYKRMGTQAEQFVKEKFDSNMLCKKILERKEKINADSIAEKRKFYKGKDSAL